MTNRYQSAIEKMGWYGIAAAGMLAVAVSVYFSYIVPTQKKISTLRQLVKENDSTYGLGQSGLAEKQRYANFVANLPHENLHSLQLEQLPALARRHNVRLLHVSNADISKQKNETGLLVQIRKVTVEGTYLAVRKWLNEVLQTMPNIGVDNLRLDRSGSSATTIQLVADLRVFSTDVIQPNTSQGGTALLRSLSDDSFSGIDPMSQPKATLTREGPRRSTAVNSPRNEFSLTYGGAYRRGADPEQDIYLIIQGEQTHRLALGDSLPDGTYRLTKASPTRLEFIDLSSGRQHSMLTGTIAP